MDPYNNDNKNSLISTLVNKLTVPSRRDSYALAPMLDLMYTELITELQKYVEESITSLPKKDSQYVSVVKASLI